MEKSTEISQLDGRRKYPELSVMDQMLRVRMTQEQYERLSRIADDRDCTMSDVVREWIECGKIDT